MEVGTPNLLSRDAELSVIDAASDDVPSGSLRCVYLEGEPGIGKSAVLAEAGRRLSARGFDVTEIAHDPLTANLPFAGLVAAFGRSAALRVVEPGVGDRGSLVPVSAQRQRGIDSYLDEIERRATRGPVALIVDDLQFADASTLVVIAAVLQRFVGLPVLVLLASRSRDGRTEHSELRQQVARSNGAQLLLGPLSDSAVEQIVEDWLGRPLKPIEQRAAAAAEGNPFFATQIALWIRIGIPSDTHAFTIPTDVRNALLHRLLPLDPQLREALDVAAAVGDVFDPDLLATTTGRPSHELRRRLKTLMEQGLIVTRGSSLAFRHHLLRAAIYESLPAAMRRSLHLSIARSLASSAHTPWTELHIAEHYDAAGEIAGAEAVPWLHRAARIQSGHDPESALRLLTRAEALAPPSFRQAIIEERVFALLWANRFEEAIAEAERGLSVGDDKDLAIELRAGMATALLGLGRAPEALQLMRNVAHSNAAGHVRNRVPAIAALAGLLAADIRAAEELADAAIQENMKANDAPAETVALNVLGRLASNRLDFAKGRAFAEQAITAAARDSSGRAAGYMPFLFGCMAAFDDEDDVAFAGWHRLGREDAAQPGLVWGAPAYHGMRADALRLAGRLSDALAEAEAGISIVEEVRSPFGAALCSAVAIDVATRTGHLERAQRLAEASAKWLIPAVAGFGFDVYATASAAMSLAISPEAIPFVGDELWTLLDASTALGTSVFARNLLVPLVDLSVRSGNSSRLRDLAMLAREWLHSTAAARSPHFASVSLLAAAAADADLDTLRAAVASHRGSSRTLSFADLLIVGARISADADKDLAKELFVEGRGIYQRVGASANVAGLRDLGRAIGVRAPIGRPRGASFGWASLSETELTVSRLVVDRLTNREIAAHLAISHRTVETHIAHIFAKLGIDARRELARMYERNMPS